MANKVTVIMPIQLCSVYMLVARGTARLWLSNTAFRPTAQMIRASASRTECAIFSLIFRSLRNTRYTSIAKTHTETRQSSAESIISNNCLLKPTRGWVLVRTSWLAAMLFHFSYRGHSNQVLMVAWLSGSTLVSINIIAVRQARLILG